MTTDLATKPGITMKKLESIVGDISLQPGWRSEADRAADYYDGKQLTPNEIAEMNARGQPVLIHNLIQPAINGVLGLEAKTRTDWKVVADDDKGLEVAEALNERLNEAARIARADRACADAYAAQIKTGIGWVEVGRNPDPFDFEYSVNYIHRGEIWWDWHAQQPDLSDARWLIRRKWLDVDELVDAFPQHKDIISAVASGFQGYSQFSEEETIAGSESLMSAYSDHLQTALDIDEYWDPDRKRALVYEVWYRVWDKKPIIRLPGGGVYEFNQNNPMQVDAVAKGAAKLEMASFPRMRMSYFVGPHRLTDQDSPHPHNKFPYIPFWGYREDRTRIPYGIVRAMMPAQDEINKRRSKLTWLLNPKLIVKDGDSINDLSDDQLLDTVYSGTGVVTLNQNRKNKNSDAFRVITDMGVANQQFQVMQEAQKMIQDVAGVYSAFLGQEGGASSGVAIDSLVEQGTTTLAEINDNFRFARQIVGELIMAHIVADMGEQEQTVRVNVHEPRPTKEIQLNRHVEDESGRRFIDNSVVRTKTRVVLSEISNTPGYRQQMAKSLMDMAGALPPEYSAALVDMIAELMDVPNRDEVLKRIRQVSGMGVNPEDMTEEEQAAAQRKQQIQQMIEEMEIETKKLDLEDMRAKIREVNTKADQMEAMTPVERAKTAEEVKKLRAEIKEKAVDIAQKRKSLFATIGEDAAYERDRMLAQQRRQEQTA